jgi:hypothetical protein
MNSSVRFRIKNRSALWLAAMLILIFWLSRLIGIGGFPPFIDEAAHVQFAEATSSISPLYYANQGRLFALWWYALFQPHHTPAAAIWLVRVTTLLAVLPGFAAFVALGRMLTGRWGLVLAGLAYLFSTYHTFFDRLGLADPMGGAAVSVALYFGYRLSRRANMWDALFTALALFVALGLKTSTLPYVGIPLAAGLTLHVPGRKLQANVRWTLIALGVLAVLIGLFWLGLRLFGYNLFALVGQVNQGFGTSFAIPVAVNIENSVVLAGHYLGAAAFGLALLDMIILLGTRHLYLQLCLIGPLIGLWLNGTQYSRFYLASVLILVLGAAMALAEIARRGRGWIPIAAVGAALAYGLVHWLPFAWTMATQPVDLALAKVDRREYIISDGSGFGLSEIRAALRNQGTGSVQEVIGVLSNCGNLQYLLYGEFHVTCPLLSPSGSTVDAVSQQIESSRHAGVYVVLEQLPYAPQDVLGRLVTVIERPGNGPHLSIIELTP